MKEDLRVRKTKTALRNSLVNLLKDKSLEKITVMEICENALVNRVTFYSHYKDKNELFVDYINNLINEVVEKCFPVGKDLSPEERIISFFKRLFNEIISIVNSSNYVDSADAFQENFTIIYNVQHNLSNAINAKLGDIMRFRRSKYPLEYISTFMIGGISNAVRLYYNDNNLNTRENIKLQINKMIDEAIVLLS